ncbi:MAG: ABC transporter substrate binding protein [Chloroflexota bacterium]|nr:ABC transporter substrate binding protein [Chloroflexota bacterium]MDE2952763.1 ABC transporter substrate binding protein [Chloroflexota bacterium]
MKKLLTALMLLLLAAPAGFAQDDKPSVFLLSFNDFGVTSIFSVAMVDALQAYGYIEPTDREAMDQDEGPGSLVIEAPEASKLELHRHFVDFQLDQIRGMVAAALDNDPDVLVTLSAPVTLAAVHATLDLPDPPAIFFADVQNLFDTGIADASCIKPAHVTGVESATYYGEILDLLLLQYPDLKSIGTLHDSGDASGIHGASQITELGEAQGITVIQTAINSLADLPLAMDALVSKDVEAVLLPLDNTLSAGLPIIATIANDAGIPIFSTGVDGSWFGAIVGAGSLEYYALGEQIGAMVAAYLNGELNPATTGIAQQSAYSLGVFVNMITADMLELDISPALQERADASISLVEDEPFLMPTSELGMSTLRQARFGPTMSLEEREARDRAFLARLTCTPERIAEQQAELDAMEG